MLDVSGGKTSTSMLIESNRNLAPRIYLTSVKALNRSHESCSLLSPFLRRRYQQLI